jgi:hypothetical protein
MFRFLNRRAARYGRDTANNELQTPAGNVIAGWNGSPDEIVGGANSGHNWQLGELVLGLESDFERSKLDKVSGPVIGLYSGSKLGCKPHLRNQIGSAVDRTLF